MSERLGRLSIVGLISIAMAMSCSPSVDPVEDDSATWYQVACRRPVQQLLLTKRGLFGNRGPDITFIPHNGNTLGSFSGNTNHSGPWGFLQRVPLVFYGPGFIKPSGLVTTERDVTLADIAPTIAELLEVDPPRTSVGKPIEEVFLPEPEGSEDLRLVVVIVWDGAGWNVLRRWPSEWPFLRHLMETGTTIENGIVGTSPSITPPVHSTIGTGAFPNRHGIVNIHQRDAQGEISAALSAASSDNLEIETLADTYDRQTGNVSKIGLVSKASALHLGLIGHGAAIPGGDKDVTAFHGTSRGDIFRTADETSFRLPASLTDLSGMGRAISTIDNDDGRRDGSWMGHEVLDDPQDVKALDGAPVWTLFQTRAIKTLLRDEGFGVDEVPDLFFTNYKDIDYLGHAWNFQSPEVRESIGYADAALRRIVHFLNSHIGPERWVLALTADHGQTPMPQAAGTWPIDVQKLRDDVNDLIGEEAVLHVKQNGLWMDPAILKTAGITRAELSNWLLDYRIEQNAGGSVPDDYVDRLDERLFDAAFPSAQLQRIMHCARPRG